MFTRYFPDLLTRPALLALGAIWAGVISLAVLGRRRPPRTRPGGAARAEAPEGAAELAHAEPARDTVHV